jgi:transposase-like protein
MNRQAETDIRRKTKVLEHAKQLGNVSHTCRKYGVSRDGFYRWKKQLETAGPEALINSKPCPEKPKIRVPKDVEEKILYVRREFGLGLSKHVGARKPRLHLVQESGACQSDSVIV